MSKRLLLLSAVVFAFFCCGMGTRCFAEDVSEQLERADDYWDDREHEQAEAIYKEVMADANYVDEALLAHERLTMLYVELGRDQEAETTYQELLTNFAGHEGLAKAVDHVADAYRQSEKHEKARELYQHVVDNWPGAEHAIESQKGVAISNIRLEDETAAQTAIDKLIADFSDSDDITEVVREIANEYPELEKYEKSVELYNRVASNCLGAEHAVWSLMSAAVASVAVEDESGAEAAIDKVRSIYGGHEDAGKLIGLLADFCQYLLQADDRRVPVVTDKLLRDFGKQDATAAVDHMGDLYRDTRKHDKAAELFEYVADTWPQSSQAVESQANIVKMYITIGDEPNSTVYFGKLISKFGESEGIAAAVENVAQEYLEFGSTQKAYEKFEYIIEHWPTSDRAIWARMGMVMSQVRAMDFEAAESELWELLDDYSTDKELSAAVHEIVEEYRNVGAYDTGRELFGWLLENWQQGDKTMLELQVGVALQSIKLGEPNKTEAAVEKLIADFNDNPNLAKGLFQIAEEHYYASNYSKTVELLELILSDYPGGEFPSKSEVPYVLATCYKHVKDYDKAIEYYKKTIEEYPHSKYAPWAPNRIGWIYAQEKKDYDNAIYWFQQQIELYPDDEYNPGTLFHMGTVYVHKLQDYEMGAEVCQQYVDEYPEGLHIWGSLGNLALCHEKLGNTEKAISVLRQAYEKTSDEGLRTSVMEKVNRLAEGGIE
jgi:tetratricopeptide (TPR) repeat protein